MDVERVQEIIQAETYIPVYLNMKQVYLEQVDEKNNKVIVYDVNNPDQKQTVSIDELSEGSSQIW